MKYEPVIGLEVHVQLKTKSKLFCSCAYEFGSPPNQNTCSICMGFPGTLPVLNEDAFKRGIKIGLALNCKINERLKFDRKNYFYPDLPKAYQISQFDMPIAYGGYLMIPTPQGEKRIGITRGHLEEDAGKLIHEGTAWSVVDYNRGGVPLMEIVSEPDLRSPDEAFEYLTELKSILRYLEVSDCDMEKGSLRCDANVSIRPVGQEKFGIRTEIKNMNSFNGVRKAIQYEIERQADVLDRGEKLTQETRLWNDAKAMTFVMRSKEDAHDYRYFPEPDLVPFTVARETVEKVRATLPELPYELRKRFMADYGLSAYDAGVLTQEKNLSVYFEEAVREGSPAKLASNLIQTEILGQMNASGEKLEDIRVSPKSLAALTVLIDKGTVSLRMVKEDIIPEMMASGKSAEEIVQAKGLVQVSDESELIAIARKVIENNAKPVEDYRAGKEKSFGFLVGQMMKETKGKANPAVANKVLKDALDGVGK